MMSITLLHIQGLPPHHRCFSFSQMAPSLGVARFHGKVPWFTHRCPWSSKIGEAT